MSDVIRANRRDSRIREHAPAYAAASSPSAAGFAVTVADRGRLVLPAEVRERLKIADGDTLTLIVEPDGGIRLLTGAAYAKRLRGLFKHLARPGRSMTDDLIAEHRREAAAEQRELRAGDARRRAKQRR